MDSIQTGVPFVPREYDVFAGLDVDKTTIASTFMDHERGLRSLRFPYDARNLLNYVARHFPGKKVAFAYEAGPTGFGLHDKITAEGFPCLVVAPSMVPRVSGQRVKTNRLDSKKLAENLRGGQLKSIRVPSELYRDLRHLVQLRDTAVRQATAAKLRMKALLLYEGIPFPKTNVGPWSKALLQELRELPCKRAVRFKLDQLLKSLEFAHKQTVETTREIRRFCGEDPELQHCIALLMTIPGVGWIVASHLVARIGDWRNLRNVRQLASFLGLAQSENSTGDDVRRGPITRVGDSRLRNKLVQSAWTAIRRDGELAEFYHRIYQRHPKPVASRKAIVAVARKLTMRIHAVLQKQRPYVVRNPLYPQPLNREETSSPRERLDSPQKQEERKLP